MTVPIIVAVESIADDPQIIQGTNWYDIPYKTLMTNVKTNWFNCTKIVEMIYGIRISFYCDWL